VSSPRIASRAQSFVNFETGQVRPLAMSPDGTRLFAINTPDNRLEVFTVDGSGLTHTGSVPSAWSRSPSRPGPTPRCGW
jgi:DNA-binding beta-propeller fold protein YncE